MCHAEVMPDLTSDTQPPESPFAVQQVRTISHKHWKLEEDFERSSTLSLCSLLQPSKTEGQVANVEECKTYCPFLFVGHHCNNSRKKSSSVCPFFQRHSFIRVSVSWGW